MFTTIIAQLLGSKVEKILDNNANCDKEEVSFTLKSMFKRIIYASYSFLVLGPILPNPKNSFETLENSDLEFDQI